MFQYFKRNIFILTLIILLSSCNDKDYIYYENYTISHEKWTADKALPFVFNIEDTNTTHEIGFTIRYNNNYDYQLLYLFIYSTLPNGKEIIDTASCYLFKPDGKPYGTGNRIKELNIAFGTLTFPQKGKYTMRIKHAMRSDTIRGINSIGMFVRPKEDSKLKNN
ncbi:MAG: gliding motility lipoprotein GldH [Bacteroidales bacterium]|nr:gliding motility lipoprotein GldH [Bacteroidales bacterium]